MNLENKIKGKIYDAKIINPEYLSLGEHSTIDDFCFIYASEEGPVIIKDYVHVCAHAIIEGKGGATLEDSSVLAYGATLLTSSADLQGYYGSAKVPIENRRPLVGHIHVGNEAFIGTNATVMQGVNVGEGAVLAVGGVATKDLEPWWIYGGMPAKKIKRRKPPKDYGVGLIRPW